MRFTIYQSGDYAAAVERYAAGGTETYYAQKYTVDFVASLAPKYEDVSVFTFSHDRPEQRLQSGVRVAGVKLYHPGKRARHFETIRALARLKPDHLVVGSPQPFVIGWALSRGIRVLPLFADSFQGKTLRGRLKNAVLAQLLNSPRIEWVSNHNIAASMDLVRIGVAREKVVPFDWPAFVLPSERPAKELRRSDEFKLIYVGAIVEAKGVGDVIEAVRQLNASGQARFRLTIVGRHDGTFERRAKELGVADFVTFSGLVPHDDVLEMMSEHDAVVVPSRHEYPEGLPMTLYEGICSRSPMVVSDHPMFKLKLDHDKTALIFEAGNARSLADQLRRLQSDPALYSKLSNAAEVSAERYLCPLKYHDLISRWLSGSEEDRRVLAGFSLATSRYGSAAA